jgi:hypothetical protein
MNITFITDGEGTLKGQLVEGRATPLGVRDEARVVKNLEALGTPASGLLPPGVRWMSASGRQVLFERPPRRMRFEYSPKQANHPEPKFRDVEIELPWTVYAIVFSPDFMVRSLQVYAANSELRSVDTGLGLMPMANTHADGHFCLPAGQPKAETLAEGIQNAYQMLWHSHFNMDVWDLLHQALVSGRPRLMVAEPTQATAPKASRLLRRWEELTRDEVLSIVDWPQVTTVGDVIANLNQHAVGAFTGWHLMSTAKQAFVTAPAKEGHQPSQEERHAETYHFDNVVAGQAQVAQTHAEINVMRAAAAQREAQLPGETDELLAAIARRADANQGRAERIGPAPMDLAAPVLGQLYMSIEGIQVYTAQGWVPYEAAIPEGMTVEEMNQARGIVMPDPIEPAEAPVVIHRHGVHPGEDIANEFPMPDWERVDHPWGERPIRELEDPELEPELLVAQAEAMYERDEWDHRLEPPSVLDRLDGDDDEPF